MCVKKSVRFCLLKNEIKRIKRRPAHSFAILPSVIFFGLGTHSDDFCTWPSLANLLFKDLIWKGGSKVRLYSSELHKDKMIFSQTCPSMIFDIFINSSLDIPCTEGRSYLGRSGTLILMDRKRSNHNGN